MKKCVLILLAVSLLWGCSKKTVTNVHHHAIFAEIYSNQAEVEILSEPSLDPASANAWVFYENVQVTLQHKDARPGKLVIMDNWPGIASGIRCSLEVSTQLGASRGAAVVPRPVDFYRPSSNDTLPWADISFAWSLSPGAWYLLDVDYAAYDANRTWLGYADTQVVMADTSAVIPLAFIQKYPGATILYASAEVYPYTGPRPGEAGNLSGDIRGYLLGSGYWDNIYFYVGSPPLGLGSASPTRINEGKRRETLQRLYGM